MTKTRIRNLFILVLSVLFAFSIISFMATKTAKADAPVRIKSVAEVRMMEENSDGKNGIRFTGLVDEAYATPTEDKFAGIIIAREESVVSELTNEDPATLDVIDIKAQNFDSNKDDGALKGFNAVLYNIPESAYGTTLYARAYVCDAGVYQYSADVTAKSIGQVASEELAENNYKMDLEYETDILTAYVDGAAGTVSVDDIVLDTKTAKDITLVGGDILEVSADKNLTPYVINSNENLVLGNNTITAKTIQANAKTVSVKLGTKTYTFNVNTKLWYEDVTETNVLSNFDTVRSVFSVQDGDDNGDGQAQMSKGESVTWIDAQTALKETDRESGMIKAVVGGWDYIRYKLETPVKVSEVSGFYVKFKMTADMETNNPIGEMYVGVNGQAKELNTYALRNYVAGNGNWNVLEISKLDMVDHFGLSFDSEVTSIDFEPVNKGATFYIDEIGILETAKENWTDENLAEGVVADFNEKDYINSIQTRRLDKTCGYSTFLNEEQAKAELGENSGVKGGVIKFEVFNADQVIRINLQKPIKFSEVAGFNIRMRHTAPDDDHLYLGLPLKENSGIPTKNTYGDGTASRRPSYAYRANSVNVLEHKTNELYDVKISLKGYAFNGWSDYNYIKDEIDFIEFYIRNGGTWYFDEISILNDAEEGYLNDFDEPSDLQYYVYDRMSMGLSLDMTKGEGGTSGALVIPKTATSHGSTSGLFPQRTVNGSKVSKIYVKIFAPECATLENASIRLMINTSSVSNTKSATSLLKGNRNINTAEVVTTDTKMVFSRGEWVELEIDVSGNKLSNRPIDYIAFFKVYNKDVAGKCPADEGDWYIDSIRYELADA